MKTLLLGLVIAMSAVLPAAATDWVYISENENGATLHLDVDSVESINGGYAYTAMLIKESEGKYVASHEVMLCRKRVVKMIGYDSYTANGQLIDSRRFDSDPFDKITVNTMKADLWEKLCN